MRTSPLDGDLDERWRRPMGGYVPNRQEEGGDDGKASKSEMVGEGKQPPNEVCLSLYILRSLIPSTPSYTFGAAFREDFFRGEADPDGVIISASMNIRHKLTTFQSLRWNAAHLRREIGR